MKGSLQLLVGEGLSCCEHADLWMRCVSLWQTAWAAAARSVTGICGSQLVSWYTSHSSFQIWGTCVDTSWFY